MPAAKTKTNTKGASAPPIDFQQLQSEAYGDAQPTRESDLKGRIPISYFRQSTLKQTEDGRSSDDRQEACLQEVIKHFGMKQPKRFADRGVSGSKGFNRTKGALKTIFDMGYAGEIEEGTPLIVERMDRFSREPMDVSLDLVKTLVNEFGIILITADKTIWDRHSINSWKNIKLLAEINQAKDGAETRRDYGRGAHGYKRKMLQAVMDWERAGGPESGLPRPPLPFMHRFPAWIMREGKRDSGKVVYKGIKIHVETLRKIFALCIAGMPCRQIAIWLNQQNEQAIAKGDLPPFPTFGTHKNRPAKWSESRVGALLVDERVLGWFSPELVMYEMPKRLGGTVKVKKITTRIRCKLYEQVIDDITWQQVRDIMDARRKNLRGRRGKQHANLFPKKAECRTCGGPLRTGMARWFGDKSGKKPSWYLICTAHSENNSCANGQTMNCGFYEPRILDKMLELSADASDDDDTDTEAETKLKSDLTTKQTSIANKAKQLADWERRNELEYSEKRSEDIARVQGEIDKLRRAEEVSKRKLLELQSPRARTKTLWDEVRKNVKPALAGDTDARERIRGLLAQVDFKLVIAPKGGVLLTMNGKDHKIEPRSQEELETHLEKARAARKPAVERIKGMRCKDCNVALTTANKAFQRRQCIECNKAQVREASNDYGRRKRAGKLVAKQPVTHCPTCKVKLTPRNKAPSRNLCLTCKKTEDRAASAKSGRDRRIRERAARLAAA